MRYPLSVKSKSVETSGIPRDYKEALCEYVWNGFEANATTISIKNKKGNRTHPISLGKLRRILPQFTLIVYHIHCKNARKNDMFC